MSIDSTAELLFNINANADDATENIVRFRALMGQNIEGMSHQFKDWADETIGEIDSVKAAMTAGIAAIAAGVAAAAVAIGEATKDYENYAGEVGRAMKLTGMSAESLSAMHSVATKTGVSFETLTNGLVKFESNVVKASQGSTAQLTAFQALGISQKDVIAGQKDLLPLLEKMMDGFHGNTSAVQKAALARDLFSRSGPELLAFLSKGSEYLKENAAEAEKLGLILSNKDVIAAREFKLAQRELTEQGEALAVSIGKHVLPMLVKVEAAAVAGAATMRRTATEWGGAFKAPLVFLAEYGKELAAIKKTMEAAGNQEETPPLLPPDTAEKVKEAKQEFNGLATLVESMKSRIAEQGTGWDRLANEVAHYHVEIAKAKEELNKLHDAGKITADSFGQEQAALARIPGLLATVIADTTAKLKAEDVKAWGEAVTRSAEAQEKETYALEKAGEERLAVTREIADREGAGEEQSYAQQKARLMQSIDSWAAGMAKKTALTIADWAAINRIELEGLMKIDQAEAQAYQEQLRRLREHLDATGAANATAEEKLYLDEQKELEQYGKGEEQKTLLTAKSEEQRAQIMQMYATIRGQITQKYGDDLQKLLNSQGFQGVFGNYFGNLIKSNQNLMRQWATSVDQSLMLVKVSMQALKDMSQQTFQQFMQGMGQTIAQAIVAKTSIGQAMEQMLKSTLESFAGQAMTAAIMATAWGFYWLMLQNYAAAGQAFTSAAIFGSVGAAAAVAGRFIPSSGSGGGQGAQASGTAGGAGGSVQSGGGVGAGGAQQQPTVNVYVDGHVIGPSGVSQLIDMINQGVYGNDMTLYASHNRQGVPLTVGG